MREGAPFAFGGLGEEWRVRSMVESFCIVTTRPNELCATVHHRMPLILREEDYVAWLDAGTAQSRSPLCCVPTRHLQWSATR
jgi:putative SOS response-associated peptidase YedK